MDFGTNHRASIARRNQRRAIESRDYKAMMVMFGILGYSAVANLIMGVIRIIGGSQTVIEPILGVVLGALYAVAAFEVWFKQYPKWWLIVLPAVLAIVLAVASFIAGTMAIAPLLLNVIVLVLIPLRIKHRNALSAIPKA
ncbi:hypothetical protein [Dyella sp.]|jgi:hypothetical protein|uniref:hypothetical protein n=1 Tax=Dyella sp. TaxID=1869338 RepID=UPI002FD89C9D